MGQSNYESTKILCVCVCVSQTLLHSTKHNVKPGDI